jgi:hypothetical protein
MTWMRQPSRQGTALFFGAHRILAKHRESDYEALLKTRNLLARAYHTLPSIKMLGLNPESPAFTCLETRTTYRT